jgi:hypothetical protein
MEHRWGKRQATNLPVRLFTTAPKIGSGRLVNISLTGAFVETPMQLRLLSVVYLCPASSRSPRRKPKGMAACVVRRDAAGFGLEWCETMAENMSVAARLGRLAGNLRRSTVTRTPGDARHAAKG